MNTEVIIDNEFGTLWYYPGKNILHHKFHKFIFSEKFRDFLTKAADTLKEKGCEKWLSDDRGNSVIQADDQAWVRTDHRSQVVEAGLKYWAVVLPEKILGQISMKRYIEATRADGIQVEAFSDPDDAMAWLENR